MSLLQRFGNLAFDPFEGHIVVPITHNHSSMNRPKASIVRRLRWAPAR
jgi:hypothetical protein